jgi:hypothetical protein
MRIGFLFNHDHIHQVAHSLPIALALAETTSGAEIVVAVASEALEAEVRRLGGGRLLHPAISLRRLGLRSPVRRLLAAAVSGLVPAAKLLVYGDNLDFFRSLDVLVVAEKTSGYLRTRYGLDHLKLVHTRHGAGDRAIGFDKASAAFDLILVSGEKIRERLIAEAGVAPDAIRVVGYPKFDVDAATPAPFDKTTDGRPVVLYNPHPSPHLSSWYRTGPAVLDWFVAHPEYRLIFAPHVMLFHRRFVATIDRLRIDRVGKIAPHVLAAPNIHVDLGSAASTDMTYTRAADLYLGDVSSQVYEFMAQPRPCVFINAHRVEWRGDPNFAHWSAGPVIEDITALGNALSEARAEQAERFRPIQEGLLARTFDLTDEPSSIRAARAIAELAGLQPATARNAATWPATPALME